MTRNIIVIPTYNERENIKEIVAAIFALLSDVSILVVDDNSPDGTQDIVQQLQKRYPRLLLLAREKKEGLGKAYAHAFKKILADMAVDKVIMMDADFSHDPKYLPLLLRLADNCDVAVGSRYVPGGRVEGWALWRRVLSRCGNRYARLIINLPLADWTGGFNLIKADFLRKIDLPRIGASGYAFIIELKYLLWQVGAKFEEVPIVFKNRRNGESKISSHIISEGVLAPWKIKMGK